MIDKTSLSKYSIGLVIEDAIDNSFYIRVIPIEDQPYQDGKVEDCYFKDETKGVDAKGEQWESKYLTTNALSARWLQNDSNRRTPPSIHKGEKVQLYRYADSEDIYWEDLGQDTKNRTTEREVKAWSNKPKRDGEELDHTNSYFLEVDTKEGLITLKTNKNNSEPFAYTFQLQTKKGIFIFEDDVGNNIYLDSNKKEILLENQSKSFIQILDKDINITAVNNLNIKVGKDMTTNVGSNQTTTVASNLSVKAAKASLDASGGYTVKTSTMSLTGAFAVKGSSMTHNGANVGSVHSHTGNLGRPVSPPF